jgi:hypothetical protein
MAGTQPETAAHCFVGTASLNPHIPNRWISNWGIVIFGFAKPAVLLLQK